MKRSDLIRSREYWVTEIQLKLFNLIEIYRTKHKLTKTQIAEKLGFTKGYITQVLNGDFDHKVSKLVDLSLAFGKVPILHFVDMNKYLQDDANNNLKVYEPDFKPIEYNTTIIIQHLTPDTWKRYVVQSQMTTSLDPFTIEESLVP